MNSIDDDGVIALSTLPKLEKLGVLGFNYVTGEIFHYFDTLKEVQCKSVKNIKEGIRILVNECKELEFIKLHIQKTEESVIDILKFLEDIAKSKATASNISIALLVILSYKRRTIRKITIKKSSNGTLSYQIHYMFHEDATFVDEETFRKEISPYC